MVELRARLGGRARRPARPSIPSVDAHALAPSARRTRVALAVLARSAHSRSQSRSSRRPTAPAGAPASLRGGDGLMVVIDVSSSTLGFSSMIAKSLLALADDPSQRAGLVLASQSAYMALPPETPGSALRGWQRMIDYINEQNHKLAVRAKLDRTPLPNPAPGDYPWVGVFTGGTRLSTGLARAMQALREAGTRDGQIVLVSDLRDAPEDLPRVGALITRMRELGIKLRVVTVGQRHARSEGVLGPRRLRLHHGRRRRRLRTRARADPADAPVGAATRAARRRARSAARRSSSRSCPCAGAARNGAGA